MNPVVRRLILDFLEREYPDPRYGIWKDVATVSEYQSLGTYTLTWVANDGGYRLAYGSTDHTLSHAVDIYNKYTEAYQE